MHRTLLALALLSCGPFVVIREDGGADASDASNTYPTCTQPQDCPGWNDGTAQCAYVVSEGCSGKLRCVPACAPGAPQPACGCSGVSAQVTCAFSPTPIAHVGYCDAGP